MRVVKIATVTVALVLLHLSGLLGFKFFTRGTVPDVDSGQKDLFPATLPLLCAWGMLLISNTLWWIDRRQKASACTDAHYHYDRAMLIAGGLMGMTISVMALSIVSQDISTKETIESLQPLCVIVTGILFEGRWVSLRELVGVIVTIIGVVLTIEETPRANIAGMVYSTVIIFASSVLTSIMGRKDCKDGLAFVSVLSVTCVATSMPLAFFLELAPFSAFAVAHPLRVVGWVFLGGGALLVYIYTQAYFVRITSSLYVTMSMSIKTCIAIIISVMLYEDAPTSPMRWIGIVTSFSGFVFYALNQK